MLRKKVLNVWGEKFIYAWLVFCMGGVNSLAYADAFLPGHERASHYYHLSIFEEAGHIHNPLPRPPALEVLAQPGFAFTSSRLDTQANFTLADQYAGHGAACFCHASPGHGYILTVADPNLLNNVSLLSRILTSPIAGRSAWLSPPDKPPATFRLSIFSR